ncbi:TetR family transcriptional regulator [Xanthobacter aminoxidans]|uniref:TetR/AcrR family transcriptional regulator n=1 Tax=Xanthobacter aminoxidans TaxID=186280 RepID=UPI003729813D
MTKTRDSSAPASGRERILAAAVARFSRQSYDQTGLREIAADAGVDVAYVHRAFGSKEQLFHEALKCAVQMDKIFDALGADQARMLAARLLDEDDADAEVRPMDILIRSLTSPKAAAVLRTAVMEEFVTPLSAHLDTNATQRAALAAALLMGVGILRDVLELPALSEGPGGALERSVAETLALVLGQTNSEIQSR